MQNQGVRAERSRSVKGSGLQSQPQAEGERRGTVLSDSDLCALLPTALQSMIAELDRPASDMLALINSLHNNTSSSSDVHRNYRQHSDESQHRVERQTSALLSLSKQFKAPPAGLTKSSWEKSRDIVSLFIPAKTHSQLH